MLRFLVLILFLFVMANCCIGQNPVQINQPYKFNSWISVRDSLRAARGIYDLALQLPTGCGAPTGIVSLNGGDKNKAAFYYDSCNGRLFVYDPKNITWEPTNAAGSAGEIQFHASTGNGFQASSKLKYDPMFGFLTLEQPGLGQILMSPQGDISLSNAVPSLGANVHLKNSDGYGLGINMKGPSSFYFPSNAHLASAKGLVLSGVDSTRISSTPAATAESILGITNQEGTYGTGKLVRIPKPTWAQTLAASPDLTDDVFSDGGHHTFIMDNYEDVEIYSIESGTNKYAALNLFSGFSELRTINGTTRDQSYISLESPDSKPTYYVLGASAKGQRGNEFKGQADGYTILDIHDNVKGRKSYFEQFATDTITGFRLSAYRGTGYNQFSITDTLFKFEHRRPDHGNLDFRLVNLPRSVSNTDSVLVKDADGRIYSRSQSDISVLRGLDSLMMQVTPSASADSLLGVVNFNELDKTNKVVKFPKPRQFVHFSQWLMNNISGSTIELSCLREGAGSVTIPKNTALTGDTYRITVMGDVSTDANTPGQLTLRLKLGNQLVAITNALELPAGINQRAFEVDVIVTFWIPFSMGLAYGRGFWKDESGSMKRFDNGAGFAQLDFTNDLDWNITAQWSNDSMGNAIRPFIVSIVQQN